MLHSSPTACMPLLSIADAHAKLRMQTDWLDARHVVFGEVVDGMDVVKQIEGVPTGQQDVPQKQCTIAGAGEL